jgi:hypothetical protein
MVDSSASPLGKEPLESEESNKYAAIEESDSKECGVGKRYCDYLGSMRCLGPLHFTKQNRPEHEFRLRPLREYRPNRSARVEGAPTLRESALISHVREHRC